MEQVLKSYENNLIEAGVISIITVVYNGGNTIEQSILSVINQTYPRIEYIIIDGGSSDETVKIIKKYADRISFWISEPDRGIYDAMNKGLKLANGGWVFFLGSDDIFYDNNVIKNVAMNFASESAIYYGNALFKSSKKIYDINISKWFLCFRNISHQTIFYPKAIYKNYLYDVKYLLFSDHIYNIRIFAENKFEFIHLPVTTVVYNDEGRSSEGIDPNYFRELPKIVWKHFGKRYALYVYTRLKVFKLKKYLYLESSNNII